MCYLKMCKSFLLTFRKIISLCYRSEIYYSIISSLLPCEMNFLKVYILRWSGRKTNYHIAIIVPIIGDHSHDTFKI